MLGVLRRELIRTEFHAQRAARPYAQIAETHSPLTLKAA
jgi:hypothetical protein